MRVLIWHVHGSWTTAFVQGRHTYVLPVTPDRGPDGLGRARTWTWPSAAVEVPADVLKHEHVDVVVLQRPHEEALTRELTGRWPGRDIPAIYLEHNAPAADVPLTRHPAFDRPDLHLVHVTHFNDLMWDSGTTPVSVIEHGVVDPGAQWSGSIPHAAVVLNDAARRGRFVGTDLLPYFAQQAPIDLFGIRARDVPGATGHGIRHHDDLPQRRMHAELAKRRVYLHPVRWTSLGLSLIEAMHLGMPVVALGTTEVADAVGADAGVVSTSRERLRAAVGRLMADHAAAAALGKSARETALARYGLARFLADWEWLLAEVTR